MVDTVAEHPPSPPAPTHFADHHTEASGGVGGDSQLHPSHSEAIYVQSLPGVVGFTNKGTET